VSVCHDREGEKGTALIVALLVMVIMTLLGVPFLLMGETENRIAENERLSLQSLYAAEAGAHMVKRWFDQPMAAENAINPPIAAFDRSLRLLDHDDDPSTARVPADGTAGLPYYKQNDDAFFRSPFRGALVDTLVGTADGPDLRIDAAGSSDAQAFLEALSDKLLGGYPGSGLRARISRIDVYGPPTLEKAGSEVRYGIATARVTTGIYEDLPNAPERLLSERTVRLVFSEIPYDHDTQNLGALHSCRDAEWQHEFSVHWGEAMIVGDASFSNDLAEDHTVSFPRDTSLVEGVDLLWAWNDNGKFEAYKDAIVAADKWIDDPWLRVLVGGSIDIAPTIDDQPWPVDLDDWNGTDLLIDGQFPYQSDDDEGNHSNYFQNVSFLACPDFSYEKWKATALRGGLNVHYFAWTYANGGGFLEDGVEPLLSFHQATHGKTGLFFFDTDDGLPPHDDDGDGDFDNLTPYIELDGGDWFVKGMVYLNAEHFRSDGAHGEVVPFEPPGEPFQDKNPDGRWDPADGEGWVNLVYPADLVRSDAHYEIDQETYVSGTAVRNARGPEIYERANVWGVLYTNGYMATTGVATYYGSVIAYQGFKQFVSCTRSPDFVWDQTLSETWPPGDWDMPRIAVSRWETDR